MINNSTILNSKLKSHLFPVFIMCIHSSNRRKKTLLYCQDMDTDVSDRQPSDRKEQKNAPASLVCNKYTLLKFI